MKPVALLMLASMLANVLLGAIVGVLIHAAAGIGLAVAISHIAGAGLNELQRRQDEQHDEDTILRRLHDKIEQEDRESDARHIDYPHG